MAANDRQEGGDHYRKSGAEQHWDRIIRLFPETFHVYFVAAITKYVERYRDKNGIQDLKKAIHYTEKLIEAETERAKKSMTCPKSPNGHHKFDIHTNQAGTEYLCTLCGFKEEE